MQGLELAAKHLVSADSMAWSYGARKKKLKMPECVEQKHQNCANCIVYAKKWRSEVIAIPRVRKEDEGTYPRPRRRGRPS